MKKALILIIVVILITVLALINDPYDNSNNNVNTNQSNTENFEIVFSNKKIDKEIKKIAFVSDMHLQLNTVNDGLSYIDSLNSDLINLTLTELNYSDIDLLVLCGDNTNSGKLNEHEELINRLNGLKPDLEILVLNGNHDISMSVDQTKYKTLYVDYGFKNALSQDHDSLSYSTIYNDLMLMMIDSGGYDDFESIPSVSENTLKWIKAQLDYAKDHDLRVINVSHYPLITQSLGGFKNGNKLIELLKEYDVPLSVSGHLHYHVASKEDNLWELVVEQVTSYPVSYEVLNIEDDLYMIQSEKIDVEFWARDSFLTDIRLTNFNDYLSEQFKLKCDDIVDVLIKDRYFKLKDIDNAKDLFYQVMKYRADGNLIDYKDELSNHEGYKPFLKIAEDTIWARWIPVVIEEANEYTKGFEIKLNERN